VVWKVIGWLVLAWLLIWIINHPDPANAHLHSAWHALFGSAG
jgi:hypothetical protein